jgi:DNA (cytosine-5)-methyltransferase 1
MKLKILDLFSGIGGFSLGLESTGHFETAAFCEIEPYCQKVLKKHWPDVPIFDDIRQLKGTDIGTIDIITGGYPCQPFSVAGKQKAEQDPRHLWPEYFRLIQELRPTWVIGENVGGHIKLGLDSVLEDLASEGYSTRTFSISASSIGANHKRERVWTVANTNEERLQRQRESSSQFAQKLTSTNSSQLR